MRYNTADMLLHQPRAARSCDGPRMRGQALCCALGLALLMLAPALVFDGGWAGEEPSAPPEPPPIAFQLLLAPAFVGQTIARSTLEDPAGGVALTFDDGPSPGMTERILDILKAKQAPATFFVVGKMAHAYPGLLRREALEGHLLGNHTWGHAIRRLSYDAYLNELDSTAGAVQQQTGVVTVLLRPPGGLQCEALRAAAAARGYALIRWSVDPHDYARVSPSAVVGRVLCSARPGSIILLHDGARPRTNTIEALPRIIDGLRAQGLRIVSLAELLGLPTVPVTMPGEEPKQG
jgi:peptidoglycan/xylan/chitin deacetylase (PgdA/CDA1 family)